MPVGRGGVGFDLQILDDRPGLMVLQVSGSGAKRAFQHESGGHRFQRIPPTEKRGRVQTSTITVACLDVPTEVDFVLYDRELTVQATRGSGSGGQKVNKTSSAIQMTHLPTGVMVRCESERSQHQNLATAKALLRAKLQERATEAVISGRNADRKAQLGVGARGDKVRSIALQRDQVTDHRTGKRMSAERYMKGDLSPLFI